MSCTLYTVQLYVHVHVSIAGQVRSGQVRSGHRRSGQVRSGQVRSGQVRSGQVRRSGGQEVSPAVS
jgi:predicted DNA-binding protein with PD1-like motif